jgi:hypothetical protein
MLEDTTNFWFICTKTGDIKWAGKFVDYDDCDQYLADEGIDTPWIFSEEVNVEEPHDG